MEYVHAYDSEKNTLVKRVLCKTHVELRKVVHRQVDLNIINLALGQILRENST